MMVAAVEDLLFSSRIRNVAKRQQVEVVFARTLEAILAEVRSKRPALVVFDLDAGATRPLDAIGRIKADAELGGTRTIAYASHVHASLISAARLAGADEVLPRSAFVAALPDIVASAK